MGGAAPSQRRWSVFGHSHGAATSSAPSSPQVAASANFAVEPLSCIAARIAAAAPEERIFIVAERPSPSPPYALPVDIPRSGHDLRDRGLQLLWARSVTVAAAIVGASKLHIVTKHDDTFDWLASEFRRHPKVTEHLAQYGEPFALIRGDDDLVPSDLRSMPFLHDTQSPGSGGGAGDAATEDARIFLGVDYGRSDVKCAVVDANGKEIATHVTRWWRAQGAGEAAEGDREYIDPAVLCRIDEPLRCLGEAALEALRQALEKLRQDSGDGGLGRIVLCGMGLSAAGCVRDGRLCGLPPAFAGCAGDEAAETVLGRIERAVLDYVEGRLGEVVGPGAVEVDPECRTLLVNDGDASALWGASRLEGLVGDDGAPAVGLFLSCGTGLAGGIVRAGGSCCGGGVLEVGKLVVGLPSDAAEGLSGVPEHDTLKVPGAAQGLAGTQRSFFNLLAARGGSRVEGKAEQRAAIVAMQKRPVDDEVTGIFETLGVWLAQFVIELSEYVPFRFSFVEAGGKLTDAKTGEIMLERARQVLAEHGVQQVAKAEEAEFGQALAMALAARTLSAAGAP